MDRYTNQDKNAIIFHKNRVLLQFTNAVISSKLCLPQIISGITKNDRRYSHKKQQIFYC